MSISVWDRMKGKMGDKMKEKMGEKMKMLVWITNLYFVFSVKPRNNQVQWSKNISQAEIWLDRLIHVFRDITEHNT